MASRSPSSRYTRPRPLGKASLKPRGGTVNRISSTDSTTAVTRGVLFVHASPSALCPHIEWAVGGVLGVPVDPSWTPQPAQSGTYRCEFSWSGTAGSAAAIASALRGWLHLRFEVTEEPT